ncbi:hypothetical protein FRC19_003197 [Serendipita sp. 401]|nr:hypothetical protein FRC19_003197 [Serendipita sp. 401]KAG9055321.1 hypothetical protein FS842_002530 [Serendipita sp. 407]
MERDDDGVADRWHGVTNWGIDADREREDAGERENDDWEMTSAQSRANKWREEWEIANSVSEQERLRLKKT